MVISDFPESNFLPPSQIKKIYNFVKTQIFKFSKTRIYVVKPYLDIWSAKYPVDIV